MINSYCFDWFNWITEIIFKYTCHPVIMFIVYDVIYRHIVELDYSIHVKLSKWEKIGKLICKITYIQLIAIVTKIKKTNQCINAAILALE